MYNKKDNVSYEASGFSKDSFVLGDAVGDKYGASKINLTASDDGPLLFKLEDCYSYGTDNKFGKSKFTISLALGEHKEFVEALELLEKECAKHVGKPGEKIMKCLYRGGKSPVLYAKITKETEIYEDGSYELITNYSKYKKERFPLNAIVKVESIYLSEKSVPSIQVKLYEAKILEEKPKFQGKECCN